MRQKWTRRTPALEEEICRRLAEGGSLATISQLPGMPSKVSMVRWRRTDPVFRAMTDAARQAVERDSQEGQALGIPSTPAFLVNGVPILGAQDRVTTGHVAGPQFRGRRGQGR